LELIALEKLYGTPGELICANETDARERNTIPQRLFSIEKGKIIHFYIELVFY